MTRIRAFYKKHESGLNLLILTAVSIWLYRGSLNVFFIADDTDWILIAKPPVDLSFFLRRTGLAAFRPVINFLFFLQYTLFGLQYPLYHLANIFFHCFNTALVYILLLHFFKDKRCVFLSALFFAVTYSHHQAVIWIGAIVDEVCAFFYLSSVLFFLKFYGSRSRLFFIVSLLMYGLALGAKETAVTLPLALLLLDFFMLRGRPQTVLKHSAPYFLMTVLYFLSMKFLFHDFSSRIFSRTGDYAVGFHALPTALSCLVQLFHPLAGTGFPSAPDAAQWAFALPFVFPIVFLLVAIFVRLSATGQRDMFTLFTASLAVTVVTLIPVSFFHSMMRFGSFTRFRYLYIPSAFFSLALACYFTVVFQCWKKMFHVEKVFVALVFGFLLIINIPAHKVIIEEYTVVSGEQKRIIEKAADFTSGSQERANKLYLAGFPFMFKYIYEPHMKNALKLYTKKNWDVFWISPGGGLLQDRQSGLLLFPENLR